MPNFSKHFVIETYASSSGLGAYVDMRPIPLPISVRCQVFVLKRDPFMRRSSWLLYQWCSNGTLNLFIVKTDQRSLTYILE